MSAERAKMVSNLRVIKLGGSLLTLPTLSSQFQQWCRANPHPRSLIIVGGGGLVDAVRQIDRANPLREDFAHWVCIDLMQHSARLAHEILAGVGLIETANELQRFLAERHSPTALLNVSIVQIGLCFERCHPNMGLPESWDVTSDALAAAFAIMHGAQELVMMKSCDASGEGGQLESLVRAGVVDPHFAELAKSINHTHFVNLRALGSVQTPRKNLA